MTTTERNVVVGVFDSRTEAERAVDELKRAGFREDQIGFAMRGAEGAEGGTATGETGTQAGAGAAGGAVAGAGIGAILGALATGLIPGIGPVIAGGLLAGILGGAAVGAAAGGLLGALTGMGVPEEEARYYEGEFQAGRAVVTVRADGRVQEADEILHRHGAEDVEHKRGGAAARATGEQTVQLREEELTARKTNVETGKVTVGKDVVEERRTLEVPVTREEAVVERHPVERRPASAPIGADARETISVPIREEEVSVEKRPVVTEEVEVGTRQVQDTERVGGTVKREELRVDREGDVTIRGWDDAAARYRSRWQQRFGSTGGRWDEYEPYYRYAHEARSRPEYRGRSWAEVEPDLRRDWETRHRDRPWDRGREALRDAWESVT